MPISALEGTPPSNMCSVMRQTGGSSADSGYRDGDLLRHAKKLRLPLSPLEQTAMVLASGWRALMRCCQPVLASPNVSASDQQAHVPSFVGRVDEGELNLEPATAPTDRVACRSMTRDATVCYHDAHQGDSCWTPTAASEEFDTDSEWAADDATVAPAFCSSVDDQAQILEEKSPPYDPVACRSTGCESALRFRPLLLSDLLSPESSCEIGWDLPMLLYEPVVLSSSLSRIDEEELCMETESLWSCTAPCTCEQREAATLEKGAHDTCYLCWTPTPRSEEFDSESENADCDVAVVPWSLARTNEERLYTTRTIPRGHRVTRPRTSRGRVFPSKAQLLSDLRMTLKEAIDEIDSRPAIVTGKTAVDSCLFSRIEDDQVDFEDNEGNCRVARLRRKHHRRTRRRGSGRRRPIPCYTAEVEQAVYLPKDESTVDEITGIPYFIADLKVEDICFYRLTANNRRVVHAQTPRERNFLVNFLSNAMHHLLPPSVEDFFAMPIQIENGVRVNGGPSILARGDEDEPDVLKALQDENRFSRARSAPSRKLQRKQAGTEKRWTYKVILRHREIILSSESEGDCNGTLSSVSEEDSDDTILSHSEGEASDTPPSGSERDASDLLSAFAMSTEPDDEAQDFDRDLRRVHSVPPSRTSYSTATDKEPLATPRLCGTSSVSQADSDGTHSSGTEKDSGGIHFSRSDEWHRFTKDVRR